MKKKFLAILLGALMLVSMIPAMGMAATETTNLIPNGDFENDFVGSLPTEAWVEKTPASGTITKVSSDGDIVPYSGSSFMKIDRNATNYSSGMTGVYWHIEGLETGKLYKFSFAYNIPNALPDYANNYNGLYVRAAKNTGYAMENRTGDTRCTFYNMEQRRAATDGWATDEVIFLYDGTEAWIWVGLSSRLTACTVYIDALSITEYVDTSFIPNGDFELPFDGNIPYEGWVNNAGTSGTITKVTSDGDIAPYSGNAFVKIDRNATEYTGTLTGMYYPITGLTAGQFYKFSFAYNIPTALPQYADQSNGLYVRAAANKSNAMGAYPEAAQSTFFNMTMERAVTNGWKKIEKVFKYDGKTSYLFFGISSRKTACVAYVDAFKIEALSEDDIPATSQQFFFDFQEYTTEMTVDAKFKQHSSRPVTFAQDPTDPSNICLLGGAHMNAITLFPEAPAAAAVNVDSVYKFSARIYIPSEGNEWITDETPLKLMPRITTDGVMVRTARSFYPADLNKWHTIEVYFNAPTTSTGGYFEAESAFTFYVDDMRLEMINKKAYISPLNGESQSRISKTGAFQYVVCDSGSATKVGPVCVFAPSNVTEGKSALAIAAVYKTEGDVRTLLDIKINELGKTDRSVWTDTGIAANCGVTSSLIFDLSTIEGETDVEYFIWDSATFTALANRAIALN